MTDTATLLRRCGLFRGFDDERLSTLTAFAEEVTYEEHSVILHEGDLGDAMFVVQSGTVQVYTGGTEGREIVLARIGPGEYFGEQALLPGSTGHRNASARAAEPVQLIRVPRSAFQSVLEHDDALRERLIEIGSDQIRNNLQQLSPLARGIGLGAIHALRRELAAGEVLFRQGDEADALYFVTDGRLAAWREENGERTLIGEVERLGCVGELALVRKDRRSATVIAEEPSEVVAIPRSAFEEVYQHSAAVREHLATLQRAYELPQRGILTQHEGTFAGHECVTTIYHLVDGGVFAAYRVVGQALYAVEKLGATTAEILTWQADGRSRELRIDREGTVIGITANGEWPDVHIYHRFVLDGGRIGTAEKQAFAKAGRFDLEAPTVAPEIVCHCVHVTGDTLRSAIKQGATTFTRLQELTSCGTVCGGCVPAVTEMLGAQEWVLADVVAEREEAPGIRSFELVPRETSYPDGIPGQHIVVEGMVRGLRLRRPYTLSLPHRREGRLRITVKLEEGGAFSPWLFDGRPKNEPLRITRPRGNYLIDLRKGPAVCIVAGIGVTPALAAASIEPNSDRLSRLLVHYSGRERSQMPCLSELETAARSRPIDLIVRETAREGRINAKEIETLAARVPKADWYLCGPGKFLDEVQQLLKQVHVAEDRVHIEEFTPVGTAPPVAKSTAAERSAVTRYLLVPPVVPRRRPVIEALRSLGRGIVELANHPLNPLKRIERRISRASGADPALPLEHFAIVSALSSGAYEYQTLGFKRIYALGAANRERALRARRDGKPLSPDTPDGDTFIYFIPSAPFPKFPDHCRVNTGWSRPASGKVAAAYVTRSRTVINELFRKDENSDRGALPYHFLQQLVGRRDIPSCPGRKSAGIIAGQLHDNATWSEDRALTAEMFGFKGIDSFGPGMSAAVAEVCATIDDARAADPEAIIDLNILFSKIAYTIIVRAVFGDVDLAEMHAHGRKLSAASLKLFDYIFEFVMGRQKIPDDYLISQQTARDTIREMVDLIRDLDRRGKLTATQRAVPPVRLILETASAPNGDHEHLFALMLPLILAGHETTGHSLSWAVYELTRQPDLEAAIIEEIKQFKVAHQGQVITTSGYDERPLTWALIAEILRRHPPLQSIPRTTSRPGYVEPDPETGIGGFRYPADAMVVFSMIGVHMDPRRWTNPEEFRIDRWLTDVKDSMTLTEKGQAVRASIRAREHAMDWIPFGDGPGRCTGSSFNMHEFFVVLDGVLPRYRFELVDPERPVGHSVTLVVGPERGKMAGRIRPR